MINKTEERKLRVNLGFFHSEIIQFEKVVNTRYLNNKA